MENSILYVYVLTIFMLTTEVGLWIFWNVEWIITFYIIEIKSENIFGYQLLVVDIVLRYPCQAVGYKGALSVRRGGSIPFSGTGANRRFEPALITSG